MPRYAALVTLLALSLFALPAIASDSAIPPPHHADATFAAHDTDPTPTISIIFPAEGDVIAAGETVKLKVDLQGLTLGDKAFHVHVWVDDKPYAAMYDAFVPFEIKDLAPGTHSIRVAPSRPWHELFKNEGAYDAVNFVVGTSEPVHSKIDFSKPTLTYSRPKKNLEHPYVDARNLIFDWYLSGTTLGEDGVYLRMTMNDKVFLITSWSPLFFENAPAGDYSVKLELMQDGELMDANFNPFTATFKVLPEDPSAIASTDPHAGH